MTIYAEAFTHRGYVMQLAALLILATLCELCTYVVKNSDVESLLLGR
jgi:hypothetical protein